ncbi:MAG: hypothetical protein ACLRV7_02195 [Hoylesella buccalis]
MRKGDIMRCRLFSLGCWLVAGHQENTATAPATPYISKDIV